MEQVFECNRRFLAELGRCTKGLFLDCGLKQFETVIICNCYLNCFRWTEAIFMKQTDHLYIYLSFVCNLKKKLETGVWIFLQTTHPKIFNYNVNAHVRICIIRDRYDGYWRLLLTAFSRRRKHLRNRVLFLIFWKRKIWSHLSFAGIFKFFPCFISYYCRHFAESL